MSQTARALGFRIVIVFFSWSVVADLGGFSLQRERMRTLGQIVDSRPQRSPTGGRKHYI